MSDNLKTPWGIGLKRRRPAYMGQEEDMAKRPGATKQPNSGRFWTHKGDVVQKFSETLTKLLIDNKGPTEKKSFTIERKDWLELRHMANATPPGCIPALQITLQDVALFTIELPCWDHVVDHIMHLEGLVENLQDEIKRLTEGEDGNAD